MGSSAQGTVEITVKAKDKTGGVFKGALGKIQGLGKAAAAAGIAAVAATGVAVTAIAAKSVGAFIAFEDQMNEVFTLLPGISEEAMGAMRDDVQKAAIDMGRLPEEVIPALYQSLSAGVPTDNVFEFMDTAHKAALGGVTDLETAVDGITSVVNAYGSDVVDATAASDIMFTAVRLGKTDFNQLSSSLFNVIPTASSLGVSFEDVSATLAVLTGQGTPTKVATTQIRAALVEASKGGTKLDKAIQEMTGSTFPELIQQGTSMPGIFEALRSSMPEQEFKDLFGSVEAVNAVLGITGPNFDKTVDAMEQMNSSAGATEAAYDVMNQGFARTKEVIQARLTVAMQKLGEALMPLVKIVADKLMKAFDDLEPVLTKVTDFIQGFIDVLFGKDLGDFKTSGIIDKIQAIIDTGGSLRDFFTIFEDGSSNLDNLFELFGMGESEAQGLAKQVSEVANKVMDFFDAVVEFLTPIWEWIKSFVSLRDILMAAGVVIASVILPIIGGLIVSLASVLAPVLAIIAVIAILRNAWENDWGGIRTWMIETWENTLKPALMQLVEWLQVNVPLAIEALKQFWEEKLLPAIRTVSEFITGTLIPVISDLVSNAFESIKMAIETLKTFWEEKLLPAIQTVWAFIQDSLIPLFHAISEVIHNIVILALTALQGIWENVLLPAITKVWEFLQDKVIPILEEIVATYIENLKIALGELQELWENVLLPALEAVWGFIQDNILPIFQELIDKIVEKLSPVMEDIKELFNKVRNAIDDMSGAVEGIIGWLKKLADRIASISLPDWMTPGSPTPFELGVKGMNKEIKQLAGARLPQLKAQLAILDTPMTIQGATGLGLGEQRLQPREPAGDTVNNYNLNIATAGTTAEAIQSFDLLVALSSRN